MKSLLIIICAVSRMAPSFQCISLPCSRNRASGRQTDTQTHKPSTVALAAHARRGLIKINIAYSYTTFFMTTVSKHMYIIHNTTSYIILHHTLYYYTTDCITHFVNSMYIVIHLPTSVCTVLLYINIHHFKECVFIGNVCT